MQFRTTFKIEKPPFSFHYQSSFFSVGSCFAQTIAQKLAYYKCSVLANPFGTLFNPISIVRVFSLLGKQENLWQEGFLKNPEQIYYHYDFHSELKSTKLEDLQGLISQKITNTERFIADSQVIIITLGTAWVYEHLQSGRVVANCHKMPQNLFQKRLLSVEEILENFEKTITYLKNKQIILTVSPVRHTKDTLPLNAVSKSVLRLACHYLTQKYENIFYFPSFELLNDDLRDYRFYAEDLIHPNAQAENYIWEHFAETFFEQETLSLFSIWDKIDKQYKHKPFNPHSEAHLQFLHRLKENLLKLSEKMNVSKEIEEVEQSILYLQKNI